MNWPGEQKILYCVHCIVYTLHYTLGNLDCSLYTFQFGLYTAQCSLFAVQFPVTLAAWPRGWAAPPGASTPSCSLLLAGLSKIRCTGLWPISSVQSTVKCVQFTVYSCTVAQFTVTVYSVQCTVFTVCSVTEIFHLHWRLPLDWPLSQIFRCASLVLMIVTD